MGIKMSLDHILVLHWVQGLIGINIIYGNYSNIIPLLYFLVQNCKIHHSVVGLRSCISEGAIIEDTLLMGADYYEVRPSKTYCYIYGWRCQKK